MSELAQLQVRLQAQLQRRGTAGLLRERTDLFDNVDAGVPLNFSSNDYLGLSCHPAVVSALKQAATRYGVGSGASHLVTGHHRLHSALEERLAAMLGYSRGLLFSSGYMANLAVLSTLAVKGDRIFQDKLNHASLLDGATLAAADQRRYAHNDMDALERRLTQFEPVATDTSQAWVVTDGVFSMDGDCAPLDQLVPLCERHQAAVIVDDAHGFGVLGPAGLGTASYSGIEPSRVPLTVITLGKAVGVSGAVVLGSACLIEYLMQYARPYIYTTAESPALSAAALAALDIVESEPDRRSHLQRLIASLRDNLTAGGWQHVLSNSHTPIQPLILGDAEPAMQLSRHLQGAGIKVSAIRPPTVPLGSSRLRITLTAEHTCAHVQQLSDALLHYLPKVIKAE